MIRGIVFDFGNVLCELHRERANEAIASHSPLGAGEVDRILWGGELERDSETGRIDSREHFRRVKAAIGARDDWSYEEFVREFGLCIVPSPEGEDAIEAISRRGSRTFILSNTNYLHSLRIFGRERLATYPELHALSYKVGCMKPDPRIWEWLLARAGAAAADCLYIDDVPAYCEAAAALGFSTLRYHYSDGNLLQRIQALL